MNGVVAMLGEVKNNLNSESFESFLQEFFKALDWLLSSPPPIQMHLCLLSGEGTPGRIRKQLISPSPNETEEIWSLRDTQSIGDLPLNFEMRDGAESDEAEEIIPVSLAPTTREDSSDEEDYGSDDGN
jgi:hypothetical protein